MTAHRRTAALHNLGCKVNAYETESMQQQLEEAGLTVSGTSPDDSLVETVELADHPFFVGVQYHPEFKSRPNKPHPLFLGFIASAIRNAGLEA